MDQIQFSKQVQAEPDDIVVFRVHAKNTTDKHLNNPEGLRVSDSIITETGINIGGYRENGDAYVFFYVRVGEEAKKEDTMIYRMIAQCSAGSVTGTIEDTADVIVESK